MTIPQALADKLCDQSVDVASAAASVACAMLKRLSNDATNVGNDLSVMSAISDAWVPPKCLCDCLMVRYD